MSRDPRIDPRHEDYVQVRDDGRVVHDSAHGKVVYRSTLDGTLGTVTIQDWRSWASASKIFHTKGGQGE